MVGGYNIVIQLGQTLAHQLRDWACVAAEDSRVEENDGLPCLVVGAVAREDHVDVVFAQRKPVPDMNNK